jgi:hypothetical protein
LVRAPVALLNTVPNNRYSLEGHQAIGDERDMRNPLDNLEVGQGRTVGILVDRLGLRLGELGGISFEFGNHLYVSSELSM